MLNRPHDPTARQAGPRWRIVAWCVLVLALIVSNLGCRAIRARSESRQSIAARRLTRQGLEAMHRGQWEAAEDLFAGALDLNGADDRANWGMAETLWRRNERDQAVEYMQSAVRLSGSHPELLVRLGRMQFELGNLEDAERQAAEALPVGRELPDAWALHGDCLRCRGQGEAALAAYHRALALQPDFPEVQIQAAELYRQQGRYDRLLATLDRLRDSTGDHACPTRVHMLRGIAMRQLGRPDEAAQCFAIAARQTPADPNVHLQIASLSLETNDFSTARLAMRKALELDPQSPLGNELGAQIEQRVRLAAEASQETVR
ncbi:tetratricopeptide repeat protein [Roseimaritima ulvae]|uniref:Tetratricopeptide repeat protein n=1 Tax=Roseimaritima ulvae TaxID=980254 RepID=A0A5B9QV08_9BACT|nr:tetratricopeptide repeat protein [Roseimaritima ulvae]QEG42864.1 tetratricopeptide repeat protein [Roseimaritima ulvae]